MIELIRYLLCVVVGVFVGAFWSDLRTGAYKTWGDAVFSLICVVFVTVAGIVGILHLKGIAP